MSFLTFHISIYMISTPIISLLEQQLDIQKPEGTYEGHGNQRAGSRSAGHTRRGATIFFLPTLHTLPPGV